MIEISLSLRYIDFDHEVRLSVEHLNEVDKKLVDGATDNAEPKKKKFKVNLSSNFFFST